MLVTGGSGFIGYHVVRRLRERRVAVRCLVRPSSNRRLLAPLGVDFVEGDLRDAESLKRAMDGCRRIFHVAALYAFDTGRPQDLYDANVGGTRNVMAAAKSAGVERVVYTSTVGALAVTTDGTPVTEETPVDPKTIRGPYKHSKYLAEQEALGSGAPVVAVNPTAPIGPFDAKPTPTGKMIVDFLCGRMPGYVDTGLNLVAVEDVGEGHVLAAEKGRVGQRYILGNANLTLKEIGEALARVSGLPAPKWKIPHAVAVTYAWFSTAWGRLRGRPPVVPIEAARLAKYKMFFDSSKAVRELGMPQSSVEGALARAVQWYRANGYAK